MKYATINVSIEESKHKNINNAFVFILFIYFLLGNGPQYNALLIIAEYKLSK